MKFHILAFLSLLCAANAQLLLLSLVCAEPFIEFAISDIVVMLNIDSAFATGAEVSSITFWWTSARWGRKLVALEGEGAADVVTEVMATQSGQRVAATVTFKPGEAIRGALGETYTVHGLEVRSSQIGMGVAGVTSGGAQGMGAAGGNILFWNGATARVIGERITTNLISYS